ncbi:hypothetical protein SAMN02745243_01614 [Hespellia stercorisuis DSM 15480]|uniref:Uncharacterized protein n=2 Tax=Hespellia stercorisuis TaxID=180311 RepID=A0A1M6MVK3_9FIRM|nr:hypothetical protein SAMN02745243_01614 [Hespellia stercorisuis DSM 15480]
MEQTFMAAPGVKLYECNPDLNTGCNKSACKYNTNAIERECHGTTKKEFALKIGQTAETKNYTPPV